MNLSEGSLLHIQQCALYFAEIFTNKAHSAVSLQAEVFTMFQLPKVRHVAHHLGLALYQPLQLIDSFL